MLIALLATALLLVVLVLVKPGQSCRPSRLNSFLTLALIAIFLLGTNAFCPLEPSYRSALSSRVAFSALEKLKSVQGQPLASYIFLIEGSSVTSRGIDGEPILCDTFVLPYARLLKLEQGLPARYAYALLALAGLSALMLFKVGLRPFIYFQF